MTDFVTLIAEEPAGRERRTRHSWGNIEDGEVVEASLMPWPAVVVLEESEQDAMLYRYDALGNFGGDSWHESVEDAMETAAWEYEGLISGWTPVPEGAGAAAFAMDQVDWTARPGLLLALWSQHETRLVALVSGLEDRLPEAERAAVLDLIGVNEFGVAFDQLVGVLAELGAALPSDEMQSMNRLAIHLDENGRWREWAPLLTE